MPVNLGQLDSITNKFIARRIADNVYGAVPLIHRLRQRNQVQISGGTKIREPLVVAKSSSAAGFTGTGPLPTTMPTVLDAAEYDWVSYSSPIAVSRRDEAMNDGPEGVIKLLENLRMVAELDLKDTLGADAVTGNASASDASKLDGLQLMVDDDDTPKNYGGISAVTNTFWKADDSALSAVLDVFSMQKMFGRATFGNDSPTVVLVTQDIWNKYWSLLQADKRFVDAKMADAGFQTLGFNGIPVIVDPNVPSASSTSQTMYMLNERYINLYVKRGLDFFVRPFQEPENQWSAVSHIMWMGQLTTNRRKAHSRLTAVDPT